MKFKVSIPAQTLRIEIPEQEFEMEFQPIWEMEPPIIHPIDPEPPIEPEEPPIEEVFDLDSFLYGKSGVVYLPEHLNNKESVIKSAGMIKPGQVTALVGRNATFTFENWNVTPTQLFDLAGCFEFGIVGIAFVCPPNRPIMTGFPDKEVFGWERDTVSHGKFAWINAPETTDIERVTFGLCRFAYSSTSSNKIYVIGKNLSHNGFNFTQVKNPNTGNLNLILQNIKVHNPIIEPPQSHYYSPTRVLVRIKVENGIAKIISDNTFDQILTWVGYNYGNQRSILNFDRFVYDIAESKLLDNKTLVIDNPYEFHPLDVVAGKGKVLTKQVDFTRVTNWEYTYEATNEAPSRVLPTGEYDAYICYKGNAGFSSPFITKDTKFADWYVTTSQGYGWTWYNEEFSGYIENYHATGFHWNTGGSRITEGVVIKNSTFEQGAPTFNVKTEGVMPTEAQEYINYLESLAI